MKNVFDDRKIIIRTWGSYFRMRFDFYEIVKQKSNTRFYMQKVEKKLIAGSFPYYGYFVPTNICVDDIKLVKKVKQGYRFGEFQIRNKDHWDVLYFQDNEKQIEWDGYPFKFSVYCEECLNIYSEKMLKADKIYQDYIRPLERRKKFKRLDSIYAGIKNQ